MVTGPLRLFVKSPSRDERVYNVAGDDVVIGRDPAIDVPVEDRTLSRRHCRLYLGPDGWRVTDLGSRNGTFLNGSPILDDRLQAGDKIEIGETVIALYFLDEDPDTSHTDLEALLSRAMRRPRGRGHAVQEHQREIRALRHLMELNEKINALSNEDQLLEGVLDASIELTDAQRGFLLLRQEDHFVVRRARLPDHRDLDDPHGSISVSVATTVIREGKSILSEDLQMDDRFEGTGSIANLRLRSLVCVPLLTRKGIIGAIYLDNAYERGTFDGWDVRVLESFASLASIAIRNARARREMAMRRREAVRQSRRIERLNDRLKRALKIRTNALREAREELPGEQTQLREQ